MAHVVKFDYNDGVKLATPETWCGVKATLEWTFVDAQHAALSCEKGNAISICRECKSAIINALNS